ncbi:MAG TPA: ABC transporter permease [Bryobacteraceae bacterium]|nr:ABC transporter permease [Bryobacteraceae bacterium]
MTLERPSWILTAGSRLVQDTRGALRALTRAPGFTLAAVLTLALGIGANTAIFSVADAVLLRPLPYPHSDRLVMVWNQLTVLGLDHLSPVRQSAQAYRALTNIFDATGGFYELNRIVTGAEGAERVPAMMITRQGFEMLAPRAESGRLFTPDEYRPNAEPVTVLSAALFRKRYGGDPSLIGKSITIDGIRTRVVGVLTPDFDFNLRAGGIDLWTPKIDTPQKWGNSTRMIARLAPGVSLAAAQYALDAAARHVDETDHPYRGPRGEDAGYRVRVVTFREQFLGDFRAVTLILLCAVAAVLLIACVNVANLLLARAASREKEIAVRRALGATGGRLMAQCMTESVVLALIGGALGSTAAVWGVRILIRLSPAALPAIARISVDWRALVFTLAVSFLVALLFGLAPAVASVRMAWNARGSTRHSRHAATTLITVETALAVILLIGAGLLLKSFSRLRAVDPGFNPSHLLTMQVQFPATRPVSVIRSRTFYADLRDKLAALPGVAAATIGGLPLRGGVLNTRGGDPFSIKGRTYGSDGAQFANLNIVGLDYFRAFQIPLRAGRWFAESDSADAPRVVVVNETLAHKYFPDGAVGQQLGVPKPCADLKCDFDWSEIVGVAGDVKAISLDQAALPMIYIPHAQQPFPGASIVMRTAGDPLSLAREAAAVVRSMDPEMPVFDVQTMDDRVAESLGQPRFETLIVGFFAVAALFLAAIGIFGVVAHSTAQRTQEIGIRMALGADAPRVVRTVVLDGLRPVLAGVLIGLGGALALSRVFSNALFQVPSNDPATFLAAGAVLTLVAAVACLGPARRAASVDPMEALRAE